MGGEGGVAYFSGRGSQRLGRSLRRTYSKESELREEGCLTATKVPHLAIVRTHIHSSNITSLLRRTIMRIGTEVSHNGYQRESIIDKLAMSFTYMCS